MMKLSEPVLTLRETMRNEDGQKILARLVKFANNKADAEVVAKKLLDTFGSVKNVLEARPEQLAGIVSGKTLELIQMMIPVFGKWKQDVDDADFIRNSAEAEKFCLNLLAGLRHEEMWVISLTAKCRVIGKRCISTGNLSECSAYPRKIVETALNYNAHSVLLCHNHPGGTYEPSQEDIASTLIIQKVLNGIDILVLDHIIIADDRAYSMIKHGDIDYRRR